MEYGTVQVKWRQGPSESVSLGCSTQQANGQV